MRIRYKIAANTVYQIAGRGVSAVTTFAITIILARFFGVEVYGDFTKIITFISFFYLLADFGYNAVVVKKLGETENKTEVLANLLGTRIILGSLLTWLAMAITVILPYSEVSHQGFNSLVKLGIILFAPTILMQAVIRSNNALFQFKLRYDKAFLALALGSIAGFLLVGGVAYWHFQSLLWIIVALLCSQIITTIFSFLFYRNLLDAGKTIRLHLPTIINLTKKTLPLGLTLVLNIAFFRLDTFLLTIFRSTTEVGLYGLAYKIFEFLLIIPTFFMNSVYPLLIRKDTNKIKIIKTSAFFLTITALVLTFLLWFLAPSIKMIRVDFAGSVTLFRILSLWLPLFFLSSLGMWVMIANDQRWLLAGIYIAGLLINLVLNLIFIPSYGATAAALTTGLTEFLVLLLILKKARWQTVS